MPPKLKYLILLVAIWASIFAASYFMSARIEGPRNLDTGLHRLDVFARYQIVAFTVAVISAVLGIVWRREGKKIMLHGHIPLQVTALQVAGIIVATMVLNQRLSPDESYQPPKPTASAMDIPVPSPD